MTKRTKILAETTSPSNPDSLPDKVDNLPRTDRKKTSKSSCFFLGIITFLLSGLALLLSWYALQKNRHLEHLHSQQLKTINEELASLNQKKTGTENPLEHRVKQLNENQTKLKEHLQTIDNSLESALKQPSYDNQDWVLLKVRYYLELAQINANWGQEQKSTLMLLEQANNLLKTFPNQALVSVRQAITQEMNEIQAIPHNENTEILKQLESMQASLSELPLRRNTSSEINPDNTNEESSPALESAFRNNIKQLSKLVVVRRSNNIVQTLIPMYQTLLIESVRMELQEAQWAVIQNNFIIYPIAIEQAIQLIKKAFDTDNEGTQNFIKKLESFRTRLPVKNQIELKKSLELLNKYIETKIPGVGKTGGSPEQTPNLQSQGGGLTE